MGPTNEVMAETVLMVVLLFSPVDGKSVLSDSHYSGFFSYIQCIYLKGQVLTLNIFRHIDRTWQSAAEAPSLLILHFPGD
jgi:hypothetical protein